MEITQQSGREGWDDTAEQRVEVSCLLNDLEANLDCTKWNTYVCERVQEEGEASYSCSAAPSLLILKKGSLSVSDNLSILCRPCEPSVCDPPASASLETLNTDLTRLHMFYVLSNLICKQFATNSGTPEMNI